MKETIFYLVSNGNSLDEIKYRLSHSGTILDKIYFQQSSGDTKFQNQIRMICNTFLLLKKNNYNYLWTEQQLLCQYFKINYQIFDGNDTFKKFVIHLESQFFESYKHLTNRHGG